MIKLENVSHGFGGTDLLSNVSLDLPAGSFHFLTGPSGAGKTTLLRLCYMDLQANSGTITVFGSPTSALSRDEIAMMRRRCGVVHQDCRFLDHLNIAQNVALPLHVSDRADPGDQGGQLHELLSWVGLADRAQAFPAELSGGERQRAALARAVIMSPDIIIADEPTGNIDWDMSQRVVQLLVELNKSGKTVLMATHDLALIRATKAQVAARVLRIQGRQVHLAGADL